MLLEQALLTRGGVTNETPLSEYATSINNLPYDITNITKLCNGTLNDGDFVIPNVTTIKGGLFYGCNNITSINIPSSCTSIGMYAFTSCTRLKNINIQNKSVKTVGGWAFSQTGISDVSFLDGVETLPERCFFACQSLVNVIIPNTVTTIGVNCFYACYSVKSVIIPDSVVTIANQAFHYINTIEYFEFGSGVTSIGQYGVGGNKNTIVVIKAVTPPTIVKPFVTTGYTGQIFVPDNSLNDYKTATNWSTYASFIYPMSQLPTN